MTVAAALQKLEELILIPKCAQTSETSHKPLTLGPYVASVHVLSCMELATVCYSCALCCWDGLSPAQRHVFFIDMSHRAHNCDFQQFLGLTQFYSREFSRIRAEVMQGGFERRAVQCSFCITSSSGHKKNRKQHPHHFCDFYTILLYRCCSENLSKLLCTEICWFTTFQGLFTNCKWECYRRNQPCHLPKHLSPQLSLLSTGIFVQFARRMEKSLERPCLFIRHTGRLLCETACLCWKSPF